MNLTESGQQKQGRWQSYQQAQHAKLYIQSSVLLLALKEGTFGSPGIPPGGSLISAWVVPLQKIDQPDLVTDDLPWKHKAHSGHSMQRRQRLRRHHAGTASCHAD